MRYDFPLIMSQTSYIVSADVDLDDLLTSRPGGIVRCADLPQILTPYREWWEPIEDEV